MEKTWNTFLDFLGIKENDIISIKGSYSKFKVIKYNTLEYKYILQDENGLKYSLFYLLDTKYEIVKSILDNVEKRYLENILRPFKNKKDITITKYGDHLDEYISIERDGMELSFPFFKSDTMYRGMELEKEYTMEELGLFKK